MIKFEFKKSRNCLWWMDEKNGEVRDHFLFSIAILEDLKSDARALCVVIWKYIICIEYKSEKLKEKS